MEKDQELFEKIDAYVSGNLKGDDLELFENTLKFNNELQEEVEKHRLVKEALKDKDIIDFREKLKNIDQEIEEEKITKNAPVKSFKVLYKIAAVLIILLGASYLFRMYQQPDLYADYYVPYPMSELTRTNEVGTIAELKKVSLHYKREKYQETIAILENLIQEHPKDDRLKLYLGNSYLNTNQEEKAIALFENFVESNQYYNDALWFLSLAHLKMKNKNKAIVSLKKLSSYESLYKKSAKELVEKLN